jgi:hypothetical protein
VTQQWTGFEVRRGRVQHVALVRILRRAATDRDHDEQSDRFDPADFVRWSRGLPRSRTAQAR